MSAEDSGDLAFSRTLPNTGSLYSKKPTSCAGKGTQGMQYRTVRGELLGRLSQLRWGPRQEDREGQSPKAGMTEGYCI